MTQYTNIEYKAETGNLFPTNGIGAISALDIRTHFDNTADSLPFKLTGQTSPPSVNDDTSNTAGNGAFEIGDFWIDETNDVAYVTLDNSTGAAVWTIVAAVSGNVTISGTPINNQLAIWTGTDVLEGDASLLWDGATFTITGTHNVDGDITVTGNVDGRDVAVDGTKLDTIEASATADQTGAQIKTAYEAEVNAFTDAQFTKLGTIEDSATADQTGAEIKTAYEAEANAFTDTQFTKLGLIEASATADQTGAEIVSSVDTELGNALWKTSAYDIRFGFDAVPTSDQVLDRIIVVRDIVIPANCAGSAGVIDTNPTASFVITLNDDAVAVATVTISTGGAYTFATTGGIEIIIATGSILTIDAPNTVDATAAGAAVTILGSS